jgi:hypothetical protein
LQLCGFLLYDSLPAVVVVLLRRRRLLQLSS